MSTEKRRGAVANGDAANDVELAPAQPAENGADGGAAVKGSPANILAGGVDQAAAYVPPTPPPRHARTKTLDMKRVRVASSADPRNAPTQKIMLPRPPTPPAGAGTPAPAVAEPVVETPAPPVTAPAGAEPQHVEPAVEEAPVVERGAEVDAERHRILQVLVVLLSAVAVLIVGAVVIILRMNRQPTPAPQPTVTAVAPTGAPTGAPTVEPPVAPTVQATAPPTAEVQPPATATPDPTADVAPTAPVVTTPPVTNTAPTGVVGTPNTGTGKPKPPKPPPTTPTATQPQPTSTFSPIFELP
jgi:hypothetical protein